MILAGNRVDLTAPTAKLLAQSAKLSKANVSILSRPEFEAERWYIVHSCRVLLGFPGAFCTQDAMEAGLSLTAMTLNRSRPGSKIRSAL